MCDFEAAEYNALSKQFPNSTQKGCLFHFKKAIHEKIEELKFSDDMCGYLMYYIDMLVYMPRDEIEDGILFIQMKMKVNFTFF